MKGSGLYFSRQIIKNIEDKERKRIKEIKKRKELSDIYRIEQIIKQNPAGKPPSLPWEITSNFPDPIEEDLKKGKKSNKKAKKSKNKGKRSKKRGKKSKK